MRLTFEVHDGGIFVKESDVKTYEVEDEIMHTGNAVRKLAEYEDLEEQGKLLIMAYEICIVSECNHCNYVKRRIEETWIQPELLSHDGFYKTKEEAEAALKELERGKGE